MRFWREEFLHDYSRYRFGYHHWAELEAGDALADLYAAGYLPYSADLSQTSDRFYLARSLRLDLGALALDKKRRHLQRTGDALGLDLALEPLEALVPENQATPVTVEPWGSALLDWIAVRYTPPYLDAARLVYLRTKRLLNARIVARRGGREVACVLLPHWPGGAHYWFAAWDPALEAGNFSPGRWLIGAVAALGQARGWGHLYLGTAYGARSAYKSYGFSAGVSWWNGSTWVADRAALAQRQASDS